MVGRIIRHFERVDAVTLEQLRDAGSAAACEAQGRSNLMASDIRPIYHGARCAGSAITIEACKGDNIMLLAAIELAQPSDILVLRPNEDDGCAYFGDMMATFAKLRGCGGLVIEAGVRDVADLKAMNFPVWAKSICAAGTDRGQAGGNVNLPIRCGGVEVNAGDIIVADDDGVCVVPFKSLKKTLERVEGRLKREESIKARLRSGESGLDVFGAREQLDKLGVVYVD